MSEILFVFVKSYSISSVRLQRTMQIACVFRSVLIACLITLSLEHEIIVFWKKFWNFYPNICANSDYENSTKGTNNYPFTADHYYGKVLDALLPAKRGFHISLIGWKQTRCSSTPLLRMGLDVRKTWARTHRHVLVILGRATARFM